jgi:hypothetical protein
MGSNKHAKRLKLGHRGIRYEHDFEVLPWSKFVEEMNPKPTVRIVSRAHARNI